MMRKVIPVNPITKPSSQRFLPANFPSCTPYQNSQAVPNKLEVSQAQSLCCMTRKGNASRKPVSMYMPMMESQPIASSFIIN